MKCLRDGGGLVRTFTFYFWPDRVKFPDEVSVLTELTQVIPMLDIIKHILQYPGPENKFKPVSY